MEKLECPICLVELTPDGIITPGCCNKKYHTVCFTKCMIEKLVCPTCRSLHTTNEDIRLIVTVPNTVQVRNPINLCTKCIEMTGVFCITIILCVWVFKNI